MDALGVRRLFRLGRAAGSNGTRHRRSTPYQAYKRRTATSLSARTTTTWTNFCTIVCRKPEWMSDPRFKDLPSRLTNIDELEKEIEAVFATRPTAHWVEKLDEAQVPGGPVYTYDQILDDPHIKARKMVVEIDHPRSAHEITGPAGKVDRRSHRHTHRGAVAGPALGRDRARAGYGASEIEQLYADGVLSTNTGK